MGRGALLPISIYVKEVNPMPRLEQTIDAVFSDRDITPSDVPQLDLYMDQVLTLFDRTLSESKRTPEDKLLTKTMVNNYVKEGLITPVRGKKYTRDQIMQLLCVYHLKQTLRLSDVKALTGRADVDFESCYASLLEEKERMREYIPERCARRSRATYPTRTAVCVCASRSAKSQTTCAVCAKAWSMRYPRKKKENEIRCR